MSLIDVHVIRRPTNHFSNDEFKTFDSFWKQCLNSLNNCSDINLHILEGKNIKHFYYIRKQGYLIGESPYVSHVCDDDEVLENSFSICLEHLEKDNSLCGVYTNSYVFEQNKNSNYAKIYPFYQHKQWSKLFHLNHERPVHELVVMRRDKLNMAFSYIEKIIDTLSSIEKDYILHDAEQTIYTAISRFGEWKFLSDVFGYKWRKHQYGRHHWVINDKGLLLSQKNYLKKLLMD